jgi:hypothetical protein
MKGIDLKHLEHQAAQDSIMKAIENILAERKYLSRAMGGSAITLVLGTAIAQAVWRLSTTVPLNPHLRIMRRVQMQKIIPCTQNQPV